MSNKHLKISAHKPMHSSLLNANSAFYIAIPISLNRIKRKKFEKVLGGLPFECLEREYVLWSG